VTRKGEVSNTSNYTIYSFGYNFFNTLKGSSKNISDEKGHYILQKFEMCCAAQLPLDYFPILFDIIWHRLMFS